MSQSFCCLTVVNIQCKQTLYTEDKIPWLNLCTNTLTHLTDRPDTLTYIWNMFESMYVVASVSSPRQYMLEVVEEEEEKETDDV